METLCWGVTNTSPTSQTGVLKVELGSTLPNVADRFQTYEEHFDMETYFFKSERCLRLKLSHHYQQTVSLCPCTRCVDIATTHSWLRSASLYFCFEMASESAGKDKGK